MIAGRRLLLADPCSGLTRPAALVVESVQIDGGVYPAAASRPRPPRALIERHGILLIRDEIQPGCDRTSDFFGRSYDRRIGRQA